MSAGRSSHDFALILGRLDVVEDVLEVDVVQVPAPPRQRAREEVVEACAGTCASSPARSCARRSPDQLVREPAAGLEEAVLRLVGVRSRTCTRCGFLDYVGVCATRRHFRLVGHVALLLELLGELRASRLHNTPTHEDVDVIGSDVVEDPLVVRVRARPSRADEPFTPLATTRSASMSSPESVSPSTAMRGFSIAICRISTCFLAAREAVVEVARRSSRLTLSGPSGRGARAELGNRDRIADAVVPRPHGVDRAAQEARHGDANRGGTETRGRGSLRALVGAELRHVLPSKRRRPSVISCAGWTISA